MMSELLLLLVFSDPAVLTWSDSFCSFMNDKDFDRSSIGQADFKKVNLVQ